jgi:nucleotide-binding universal stress UspA family protein
MSAASAADTRTPNRYVHLPDPFRLIVCAVDGSPASLEGVRQAAALADANSTIELVAVTDDGSRASEVVARAKAHLAASPARVASRTVSAVHVSDGLLAEAADADLLVVGRHGTSRIGGILIGSTATKIVHSAPLPVLVAVKPPHNLPFPGRILVAADGPDHPEDAIRLAGGIALRSGTDVTLLRVDWSRRAKRPEVAAAVANVTEAMGTTPLEILVGGNPHRVIAEYAEREQASLVITGSRELGSVKALRSVSERAAHECPCSVLVLRDGAP